MNKNDLAKEVVKREGGKINLSIAQVKEVIRLVDDVRAEYWSNTLARDLEQATIATTFRKRKARKKAKKARGKR